MDVVIDAPDIPKPRAERFVQLVTSVYDTLCGVADEAGYPTFDGQVILADHFTASVQNVIDRLEHGPPDYQFTTERLGGIVTAKCIPTNEDQTEFAVVFDKTLWISDDEISDALVVFFLAHELSHGLLGAALSASGALEGVRTSPHTGVECARAIARSSAHEFRADVIADVVLAEMSEVRPQDQRASESRPGTAHDLFGDGHLSQLGDVLDDIVHPGWPQTVWRYRHGGIALRELSDHIIRTTDQLFALLAHAEATARSGDLDLPLAVYGEHPGVILYLREAWEALLRLTTDPTMLPDFGDVCDYERRLSDEGGDAIQRMWEVLGLTIEERTDGEWALWVDEPAM